MPPVVEKYDVKTFKSGGVLETPTVGKQGKNEAKKNKTAYTKLAKYHGEKYRLLPVSHVPGQKNPDVLNLTTGRTSDVKMPTTDNGKNAIQSSIHSASKQKVKEAYILFYRRMFDV